MSKVAWLVLSALAAVVAGFIGTVALRLLAIRVGEMD